MTLEQILIYPWSFPKPGRSILLVSILPSHGNVPSTTISVLFVNCRVGYGTDTLRQGGEGRRGWNLPVKEGTNIDEDKSIVRVYTQHYAETDRYGRWLDTRGTSVSGIKWGKDEGPESIVSLVGNRSWVVQNHLLLYLLTFERSPHGNLGSVVCCDILNV